MSGRIFLFKQSLESWIVVDVAEAKCVKEELVAGSIDHQAKSPANYSAHSQPVSQSRSVPLLLLVLLAACCLAGLTWPRVLVFWLTKLLKRLPPPLPLRELLSLFLLLPPPETLPRRLDKSSLLPKLLVRLIGLLMEPKVPKISVLPPLSDESSSKLLLVSSLSSSSSSLLLLKLLMVVELETSPRSPTSTNICWFVDCGCWATMASLFCCCCCCCCWPCWFLLKSEPEKPAMGLIPPSPWPLVSIQLGLLSMGLIPVEIAVA